MSDPKSVFYVFPEPVRGVICRFIRDNDIDLMCLSEIRVRINQHIYLRTGKSKKSDESEEAKKTKYYKEFEETKEFSNYIESDNTKEYKDSMESLDYCIKEITVGRELINMIVTSAARYSMYAYQDTIRQGFIPLKGGHRMGVLGQAVVCNGCMTGQKNISYINIRIAHEYIGCADSVIEFTKGHSNILIISPPGCGKTTMLRDIVRHYSYGINVAACNVTVIDERGEIAASVDGMPQCDLGPRADVCDMGNKRDAVFAALRSMSPSIIVMDEIGGVDDVEAVSRAVNAGVRVVASVHGYNLKECFLRRDIARLLECGGFEKIIILSDRNGAGTVEELVDLSETHTVYGKAYDNKLSSITSLDNMMSMDTSLSDNLSDKILSDRTEREEQSQVKSL